MSKPVKTKLKLQIAAGAANPAPPVGTALGPHGINIQDFCKKFNDATREMHGDVIPAEITVYEDRTFDFVLKTPPVASLLKKYAGIEKGSKEGSKTSVGAVTRAHVRQIAERKLPDLNVYDLDAAERMIEGTAKNMGITIKG
jgi:large subunit ribosomal protein L11